MWTWNPNALCHHAAVGTLEYRYCAAVRLNSRGFCSILFRLDCRKEKTLSLTYKHMQSVYPLLPPPLPITIMQHPCNSKATFLDDNNSMTTLSMWTKNPVAMSDQLVWERVWRTVATLQFTDLIVWLISVSNDAIPAPKSLCSFTYYQRTGKPHFALY